MVELHALGTPHVTSALAAAAVGIALGMTPSDIAKGLSEYRPQPGRLNVIAGIKHSIILDDSYNASPDSMRQALELFSRFPAAYKIAVLGTMRELGSLEQEAHEEIGKMVALIAPDYLVTVAAGGYIIADSAKAAGMPEERVLSFDSAHDAKKTVQNLLKPESLVLVKGSQNTVFLERVIKEIMAEPMRAAELLCRQDEAWNKR
jgi:UDP-N-acetylmuramoyl-tripeptide--D-alanyl-D-alanine ligase